MSKPRPRFSSGRRKIASIEPLESRTLLSLAATETLSLESTTGTPANPVYNYDITLNNTGTTTIGTFWFAWAPGVNYLPTKPISESNPAGWSALLTGPGN